MGKLRLINYLQDVGQFSINRKAKLAPPAAAAADGAQIMVRPSSSSSALWLCGSRQSLPQTVSSGAATPDRRNCKRDASSRDSTRAVSIKRVRLDTASLSPTSVRDVQSAPKPHQRLHMINLSGSRAAEPSACRQPTPTMTTNAASASAAVAAAAGSGKLDSVARGLQHLAVCPVGCNNPLCVSTRTFVAKVGAHLRAMSQQPAHASAACGACQLWMRIVQVHARACRVDSCSVPLCKDQR